MIKFMERQMRTVQAERFAADLDWNLLRTFVVIVEEGGITAAASQMLRRQPTVSLALQRLESQIGNRLIERGRGVFRLTAVGRELYRECVDIYDGISKLKEVTNKAVHELTGNINLALASHVTTPLLDELLASFHARHPQVTFRVEINSSDNVAREVLNKTASLGICLLNKRLQKLDYELLYREYFGYFCGPKHPLFGRENVKISELRNCAAVSFDTDDMADALRPVALFRKKHKLDFDFVGRSPHLEEVKRMILCGLGIGPLPLHVVERDVRDGFLWRLPPFKAPPAIDIHLITNPQMRFNRAETQFIAALTDSIAKMPLKDRSYGNDKSCRNKPACSNTIKTGLPS